MRTAEVATALCLMALSAFFMSYAALLPIGWVDGAGPGGGAFPFWLSAIMFVAAGWVAVKNLRARAARRAVEPFIHPESLAALAVVTGALVATVALVHVVGVYVAIPAFLLFYLRFVGRQRWSVTLPLVVLTPVALFFFFEVALKTLLPKGVTEPLFVPLYALFF